MCFIDDFKKHIDREAYTKYYAAVKAQKEYLKNKEVVPAEKKEEVYTLNERIFYRELKTGLSRVAASGHTLRVISSDDQEFGGVIFKVVESGLMFKTDKSWVEAATKAGILTRR